MTSEVVLFPYTKRQKVVWAETSLKERLQLRHLIACGIVGKDNVVNLEDARKELLMNTLGW